MKPRTKLTIGRPEASQKVHLTGVGVCDGRDLWKRYVINLEWKSEGVMDNDSGDDEGEEDCLVQG